eukprot:jgi/Undpi1/13381/HiC_scaffold_8.g03040.m1
MTKTRFTAADVRAMVRDLRSSVLGLRVVNVYDLDAKTYLLKLASPGQEKAVLLLESGVRFHTTKFAHTKSDMPSGFSMKLRKHSRTQRLEDVRQVGMDRVVDFKFGSGDASNHVILELYASGNIILTDHKYEILDLLRTHTYDGQDGAGGDVRVAVRQVYPMDLATTQEGVSTITTAVITTPTIAGVGVEVGAGVGESPAVAVEAMASKGMGERGKDDGGEAEEEAGAFANGLPLEAGVRRMSKWLQRAAVAAEEPPSPLPLGPTAAEVVAANGGSEASQAAAAAFAAAREAVPIGTGNGKKKRGGGGGVKKAKKATLKQALMQKGSGVSVYGPSIVEHCVLGAGLRPNLKLTPGDDVGHLDGGGGGGGGGEKDKDTDKEEGGSGGSGGDGKRGGLSEDDVRRLVVSLAGAEAAVQQLDRPGQRGYIQCKPLPTPAVTAATARSSAGNGGGSGSGGDGSSIASKKNAAEEAAGDGEEGRGAGAGGGGGQEGGAAVKKATKDAKEKETGGGGDDDGVVYEEFLPQLLAQHEGSMVHSFPSFDQAVDAFFGRIVEQKLKQASRLGGWVGGCVGLGWFGVRTVHGCVGGGGWLGGWLGG